MRQPPLSDRYSTLLFSIPSMILFHRLGEIAFPSESLCAERATARRGISANFDDSLR